MAVCDGLNFCTLMAATGTCSRGGEYTEYTYRAPMLWKIKSRERSQWQNEPRWVWLITALTLLMSYSNEHNVCNPYLRFVVWLFVTSLVKKRQMHRLSQPNLLLVPPVSCPPPPHPLCAADRHLEKPPPNPSNGVIITNQCDDSGWLALS